MGRAIPNREYWGCGRKLPPDVLDPFRGMVQSERNRSLPALSGLDQRGDVGQARLSGETTVVQTVDIVLPLPVDSEIWGRAAALHCLSDVLAAGATPLSAVGLVALRSDGHPDDHERMRRAYESAVTALNEEGVGLVGGHSMWDSVDKLGFALTGVGQASELRTNGAAAAGDHLYLTKPIGTGALLACHQTTPLDTPTLDLLVSSLTCSNGPADRAGRAAGCKCAADITGFGLIGTAIEVANHSGITLELALDAVPKFPGAAEAVRAGFVSSLAESVWFGSQDLVKTDRNLAECLLLTDPQVNGGLLLSVPASRVGRFEEAAAEVGVRRWEIGRVTERQGEARVVVH